MSMKTLTIAAAKGGCCKTTLTSCLAVRASQESERVAMFDLNADQGNLTTWWNARGQLELSPTLFDDIENIPLEARQIARDGYQWLMIDTPPVEMDLIEQSVVIADFVLIPVRTSLFDVGAIDPVVDMCRRQRVPFAFIMTALDTKFDTLIRQTKHYLSAIGPILTTSMTYKINYIKAVTTGKTGPELDKKLREEIDAIWSEVNTRMNAAKAADLGGDNHVRH